MLSRRRFLVGGIASLATLAASACSGRRAAPPVSSSPATDYADRFAGFTPDDEPDGDLTKIVWPDYVTAAGPEVQHLYEFQVTHGELMRYMPCFCGCGKSAGHRNNRDCYITTVNPDGTVVFDSMAPT